ncbi:type I DNA topoisomerase [Zymomonas mobilis]|uniref:type I DNA topoisomerase n=1 Tax=Zymomonas mobilis TaxID=542 RepID=UPI0003C748EB|nr:type I DNA topoisomerase [Zymomonas mobilis]AHB09475.1 DNA topoisomerase I, bacterial [Zymomonas mobilis subsp. mobilis str. CP4 = NRRL B-14023]AHJ69781.1 DNA topoisomerase 1 [Zymomonas mobilis subsp. mobilis NRRL B-12526]AHJ71636.1 DNA topoisomerase 1 [Zymomonas mobilis subsp. mobilis str. CP4 = NRRL B-14023]TWE24613.1 DNA topoisomerase I [Zymomonas mobilis]
MKLVVVESPAKAKTIEKYLGSGYQVLASYGHIRDLPSKDGSVNPDNGFSMVWQNYPDKAHRLKAIEDAVKESDSLILATDPDREGEAISWHILELLKTKKLLPDDVERVTFNAITKAAVTDAMAHPRQLDNDLINAYLARRALDYLVGFTLSPILWRKLPGAKSAGRVQSVALRLVVDREQEIEGFKPQEYWSVEADMEADSIGFTSRLIQWRGQKLEKLSIADKTQAEAAQSDVESGHFTVSNVETKPVSRNPQPPFTTSTLQQEAARKLGFAASHTMRLAQSLYEEGLITYMRTDGVQMDESAIAAARKTITQRYDGGFVPDKPRQYQVKAKNAQEAHEAIRPTDFSRDKAANGDHARLYELIWKRALASQMASAKLERTTVDLTDGTGQNVLRVTGQVVLFSGFLTLYEESADDNANDRDGKEGRARLPLLRAGDAPLKKEVRADQHFTQPPPRYSEASLVKKMEDLGIGRPSTYASVIQVLKDRAYVTLERNRFIPSEAGRLLTAFLERFFERYVSYDFTAGLEDSLDEISGGRADWQKVLDAFWHDFKPKTAEVMEQQPSAITAELDKFLEPWLFPDKGDGHDPRECPSCHTGRLALKGGRFGAFIACSNYPECKYTRGFGQGEDGVDDNEPVLLGYMPENSDDDGYIAFSDQGDISPANTASASETGVADGGVAANTAFSGKGNSASHTDRDDLPFDPDEPASSTGNVASSQSRMTSGKTTSSGNGVDSSGHHGTSESVVASGEADAHRQSGIGTQALSGKNNAGRIAVSDNKGINSSSTIAAARKGGSTDDNATVSDHDVDIGSGASSSGQDADNRLLSHRNGDIDSRAIPADHNGSSSDQNASHALSPDRNSDDASVSNSDKKIDSKAVSTGHDVGNAITSDNSPSDNVAHLASTPSSATSSVKFALETENNDTAASKADEQAKEEEESRKARAVTRRTGRFGPYIQLGEGKNAKRVSVPRDVNPREVDFSLASRLLALPREIGLHPESGKMIIAGTGRYGPYLNCDGKYARLSSTEELLDIDIDRAVVKLAEAAQNKGRTGATLSREPLKVFGDSPVTEKPVQLMNGRYGPYVTDGETNASLPKDTTPESLTFEEALALLEARAKMPKKKKTKKAAAKKPAAKKTTTKKAAPKKATTKTATPKSATTDSETPEDGDATPAKSPAKKAVAKKTTAKKPASKSATKKAPSSKTTAAKKTSKAAPKDEVAE